MATLVFTTLGSALGGPIGGALGSVIGSQLDRAILGGGKRREGPRLKELAVTTASYGTPIPRHFGTMRAAGSIIWATDLVESRETSGGKGRPSTTSYSYAGSFAVALASSPVRGVGRIWADGYLLRGSAASVATAGPSGARSSASATSPSSAKISKLKVGRRLPKSASCSPSNTQ
jgi:hypothetical protein